MFDGPKFIYEYYLYTAHFADPGYMNFSRQIASDMRSLEVTGFNGVMSDQTQRAYFPTALPDTVIGEFLFDTATDTEPFIDRYFKAAFGESYKDAKAYLDEISGHFDIKALSQNTGITAQDTGSEDKTSRKAGIIGNKAVGKVIAEVPAIVDKYRKIIEKNIGSSDKCHAESWRVLTYHGEYCKRLSSIYVALSKDDTTTATGLLDEMMDYLSEIEPEIELYFDLVLFKQRTSQLIAGR